MSFEKKIKDLNINLPEAKAPVGNYVATKIVVNYFIYRGKFQLMKKVN